MDLTALISELQRLYEMHGDLGCWVGVIGICEDAAISYCSDVEEVSVFEIGGVKYINILGEDL